MFIVLLASIVNASTHTKYVFLINQKWEIIHLLINLHPNEYIQELHCYPLRFVLDKFTGSCNTLNGLSNRVCVPNKTEDLNKHVFSMITGQNQSKMLTKYISCECRCRFGGKNII